MDFAPFDQRGYLTLPVREGYSAWAKTYESIVQDEMDLRLLDRAQAVDWAGAERVLDLACGTGRTGAWLRARGVRRLEGVDFTPDMLALARAKGLYDRLVQANVTATGLEPGYQLMVLALADEHIQDLGALYRETARLAAPHAAFVLVGYHPHFLMMGVPTHFNGADGQPVAVESYVHLTSDHVKRLAPPDGRWPPWTRAWSTKRGSPRNPSGSDIAATRSVSAWSGVGPEPP